MAQVVRYFQNNPVFTEGPFVIVNINGWRIEAELIETELKGHLCPVLPALSIYSIMKKLGLQGKTNDKEQAAAVCDALNGMVRAGAIVLHNGWWVDKNSVIRARETAERIMREVQ